MAYEVVATEAETNRAAFVSNIYMLDDTLYELLGGDLHAASCVNPKLCGICRLEDKDAMQEERCGVTLPESLTRQPAAPTVQVRNTKLAQKLVQLQPLIAVFPQERAGQLAYFGPT
jgi:hypothetical protein